MKKGNQKDLEGPLGLSKGRISQLVKAGVLKPGPDGLFDIGRSKAAYLTFQGEGKLAGKDPEEVAELLKLKTELTRARLEQQKAATELSRIRAQIQRGELVNHAAACATTSEILTKLYRQLDSAPLSFLQHVTSDPDVLAKVDTIYRDVVRRAFESAVNDPAIAKQNAYILAKADILIEMCQAAITMAKHEGRDPEDFETFLQFALEIRDLFFEMKPDLPERLTADLPPRLQPKKPGGKK
jgi:hypothetical protein